MDPLTIHRRSLSPAVLDAVAGAAGDAPSGHTTHGVGALGEALAVHHLVGEDGLELLARNWRAGHGELRGELDVVVRDPRTDTLVVVEVKTRRDAARFGGALTAVHPRQAARLRRLTTSFVRDAGLRPARLRLDLVAIDLGRNATLHHVPDAL
ncbi:MAG: YraN family protein [Nitriliruptoraceae bacterium]|nr:YraN family protein [Nitriliruptoraceae bacterium]